VLGDLGVYMYIMCFRTFGLYGDVGDIRVCTVGSNARTCVFWEVKWGV
jgi:hypothetical protein